MDHLERAFRKEEIPLLQKDYERQQILDKENSEKKYLQDVEESKKKHEHDLKMQAEFARFREDAEVFKKILIGKRQQEYSEKIMEAEKRKQQEKQERREEYNKRKAEAEKEWKACSFLAATIC